MTTSHLSRHRVAAAVLAAAATVTLTGCSEPLPPAERPDVVWTDGEPEGPLEDDPWVQAVRASDLELNIALNTRDFTSPGIGETSTLSVSGHLLGSVESAARTERWFFAPGPTPMVPIHVEEAADGKSAFVYTCERVGWTISADQPEPRAPLQGLFAETKVVQEDGQLKVDKSGLLDDLGGVEYLLGKDVIEPFLDDREGSDCTLDDAKVGLFDPPPDVTVEYTPEDIKTTTED